MADGLLLAGAVIGGAWALNRFVLKPMRARTCRSAQMRTGPVAPRASRIATTDSVIEDESMARPRRHKVFISYHHQEDQRVQGPVRANDERPHRRQVGRHTGDIIDQGLPVDEVRRRIRDEYIADATVTVVLIGRCTWQRKHVDWEISASLIDTSHNDRCGLLGIRLPTHTDFSDAEYNPRLIPPRLAANCEGNDPFAAVHRWSGSQNEVEPGAPVDRRGVLKTQTTA